MRLHVAPDGLGISGINPVVGPVRTRRAPRRDKQIQYKADHLPRLDKGKTYASSDIRHGRHEGVRVGFTGGSVDADPGTPPAAWKPAVAAVAQNRALNVGVAEGNMMLIRRGRRGNGRQRLGQHFLPFL